MRACRDFVRLDLPEGSTSQILALTAESGRIRVVASSDGPVRLTSDLASVPAQPDARGLIDVNIPGVRHLVWRDEGSRSECRLPIFGPAEHAACGLRAAAGLIAFPFAHARDLWAYFAQGDSVAGSRIEDALLPPLSRPGQLPGAQENLFGATPVPKLAAPVTILIPDCAPAPTLAACLDHLARHTSVPHRILLLAGGDAPFPGNPTVISEFLRHNPQAQLVTHMAGRGRIRSINHALDLAKGHVVLLSPAALVPEGWLPRLMAPLLTDATIASVTPMSNDAGIFTVPAGGPPLTPDQIAQADRTASRLDWRKAQVGVPTGAGFCMALSRSWLDRVGPLDPIFGRSQDKEVDWCRRATAAGGRHIGHGGLFVEHQPNHADPAEQLAPPPGNTLLLSSRHPAFEGLLARWRDNDPLMGSRLAIGLALLVQGSTVPVYLAHRLGGGAEHWLQDRLAADLREDGQSGGQVGLVLRDDPETGRVLVELHNTQGVTRGLFTPADAASLLSIPDKVRLVYSCLAGARDPLAFAQHMTDSLRPMDEMELIFHDFLPLCPSYCLITAEGGYCGLPDAGACQSCYATLPASTMNRPETISDWRAGWLSYARRADQITVFSDNSRALVLQVWPELDAKLVVRPHKPDHLPEPVTAAPRAPAQVLTIGVLGGIGLQKGAAVLRDLAARIEAATVPDLKVVLIGKIDPAFAHPGLQIHGDYDRSDIGALTRSYGIDVWLIPSIWPETFCYTAHECIATGLPTFTFDIGAQADVMRTAANGHVLPLHEPLTRRSFDLSASGRAVAPAPQIAQSGSAA